MKPAIIYARFSDRPNAENCLSCETQLIKARAFCGMENHVILLEERDEAISGKDIAHRPGFQRALAAAVKHKAVLVVYSLSRLARKTRDAIDIAEQLDRAGADLVSLTEKIDTTTAMGRAFFIFIATMAQLERELTAERTRDAMRHHQANGRRMSDREPYGYRRDENNAALLQEDPLEQRIIKCVVLFGKRGRGLRDIGRKLARRGILCRGGKWHHSTIKRILARAGV